MTIRFSKSCLLQLLVLCSYLEKAQPFTIQSHLSQSKFMKRSVNEIHSSIRVQSHQHKDTDSALLANDQAKEQTMKISIPHHLRAFGQIVMERSDTLRSAGFYDKSNEIDDGVHDEYEPITAGAKTNITLFLLALGYKWYRSIFINKMAIWERQPQWNTVITSKEDEEKAKLEALTCKSCGATIFIAKGRKWFQMPRGYECYCCGASGNDNFENTRDELLNEIDDDYFDYEKPLDFVTAAERKKLMKQAGGDEQKAIALLTQQNMENVEGEVDEAASEEAPKKKKKKTGKKKKKKAVDSEGINNKEGDVTKAETTNQTKKQSDDDLDDLLGMD